MLFKQLLRKWKTITVAIDKCAGVTISQLGIAMNIDPRCASKMSTCVMDI